MTFEKQKPIPHLPLDFMGLVPNWQDTACKYFLGFFSQEPPQPLYEGSTSTNLANECLGDSPQWNVTCLKLWPSYHVYCLTHLPVWRKTRWHTKYKTKNNVILHLTGHGRVNKWVKTVSSEMFLIGHARCLVSTYTGRYVIPLECIPAACQGALHQEIWVLQFKCKFSVWTRTCWWP